MLQCHRVHPHLSPTYSTHTQPCTTPSCSFTPYPSTPRLYRYTGLMLKTVWNCDVGQAGMQCPIPTGNGLYSGASAAQLMQMAARGTCCKSGLGLAVGQCISSVTDLQGNGPASACCGGSQVPPSPQFPTLCACVRIPSPLPRPTDESPCDGIRKCLN